MAEKLSHFVATGPGCWGRGSTPSAAIDVMARNGGIKQKFGRPVAKDLEAFTVFGSNLPIGVEVDDRVRVFAEAGAVLVQFTY